MQRTETRPTATIRYSQSSTRPALKSQRLQSIDLVRGLALIAMLISHSIGVVPGLKYAAAYNRSEMIPPDITRIENLFGLIWHFATPAFMLLAGVGIALFIAGRAKRGWDDAQLTQYLLIRGVLLISLDVLLTGWNIVPTVHFQLGFAILSCTGTSILILALVRKWRTRWIFALMLATLLGTQAIYYYGGATPHASNLYAFLIGGSTDTLQVWFPVLGWLPLVLLGFMMGKAVAAGTVQIRRLSLKMALLMFVIWLLISAFDGFGKLYPGSPLYLTKYPPGLDFLTFYLGWTFLLLAAFETGRDWTGYALTRVIALFGQTSLFFFVVHDDFVLNGFQVLVQRLNLAQIVPKVPLSFAVSFCALAILVVLCGWYRDLKKRYPGSLLQYL